MAGLFRKVIRIRATDSPNVRYALAEQAKGLLPSDKVIIEGVLSWSEYQYRRATWDRIRQSIGLDAQFYTGAEVMLYPSDWLNFAEELARTKKVLHHDLPRFLGCDPAEGGDKSSWAVVDNYGLVELLSRSTPRTEQIPEQTLALMMKYGITSNNVMFDRGGGGRQHADVLRDKGYAVRTVMFGDTISLEPKRGLRQISERKEIREEKSVYFNRRAQMYGEFSELLDPAYGGFSIPAGIRGKQDDPSTELRFQLSPIPRRYVEGKLKIPPKHKKDRDSHEETLTELIGHSPDELDAVVIACHAMLHKGAKTSAGVA